MKLVPRPTQHRAAAFVFAIACALVVSSQISIQGQRAPRDRRTIIVNGHEAVAGEVLVKFGAIRTDERQQIDIQTDADEDEELSGVAVSRIHSRSYDTETLLTFFGTHHAVVYVEPNYIVHRDAVPNDPRFGDLWGLRNIGQVIGGSPGTTGADIHAVAAWDTSTGSRANVVAVVDTGVDYTHQDLAANVWSAPSAFTVTIGGRTITCAQGTHGFNAITRTCDPRDDHNHGSHVSGTIGALGNNGTGVAGVNWTASIMGLKFLNSAGSGTTADAVAAIDFAIQAKTALASGANVRVLSNSWGGGGFSQALLDAINRANANGMLFVAAAGNNGTNNDVSPHYPSSYNAPNVVAVAATDNNDQLASFSNFGASSVHLGAPGVNVLSTTIGNTYQFFSGTSMATPHVSGAAALVLSRCSLDTAGLKSTLLGAVERVPALNGVTTTGGRLNVDAALRACAATPAPDYSVSATPASQTINQGANTAFTVTVTPSGGFTDVVSFSVTGLPSGATASFNPASVAGSGTSTMTVTTTTTTTTGTFSLTITGTSSTLVHSTSVSLIVNAAATPNFSLSATPASQSITQGTSTTYTVTVTPSGGFNGTVALAVSGLPAGASGSFNPASVTTSGMSTLTVTASATAATGTFTLTITGTSGTLARTTSVSLTVSAPGAGDFSVSATPASVTVSQGDPASYTVSVTPSGGFTGSVAFTVSGLPAGATASFSPPTVTTSGSSTMTVQTNAPFGTYRLTIAGTSGGRQRTAIVTLTIND